MRRRRFRVKPSFERGSSRHAGSAAPVYHRRMPRAFATLCLLAFMGACSKSLSTDECEAFKHKLRVGVLVLVRLTVGPV